jgi:hypothetical protein
VGDPLRDALSAVQRAREITRALDQSRRESDVRNVAGGIQTELLIIESSLRNALGAVLSDAVADRPGLVASDAPGTSRAVARGITVKSGSQRGVVLRALLDAGYLTDHELTRVTDIKPSSLRPRRVELVDAGLVSTRGTTKQHEGSAWTVWELTPLGSSVARELVRLGVRGAVQIDPNQCVEPVEDTPETEGEPVLF